MAPFQIHNVRFFDLQPRSAHCLSYCEQRKCLAMSRADMSIEIWNFSIPNCPILERSISGLASEGSIEALAWAKPVDKENKGIANPKDWRLFSAGLHGLVIEHHLDSQDDANDSDDDYQQLRRPRNTWPVTSGAAWCMKFNEVAGKLALGTEEGFVCLFTVTPEGLDFDKVLDKQEGRVLCLDWHTSGKQIVTGSPDTLRLWDVTSGHPLLRMSTGRVDKSRETIVWSVAILDDLTIVSGDSRGKTSFWNGTTGTLVDSYQTHKADVLAVAVSKDQQMVCSSGVDPVLMQFQPILKDAEQQRKKWVKSVHRTAHTHDVRAIVFVGSNQVVSVGVDANMSVSGPGLHVTKYPPLPHGVNVVVASDSNFIALRKQNSVEVWRLGKAHPVRSDYTVSHQKNNMQGNFCPLQDQPLKVIELQTKDDEVIENIHMSANAEYVAYVTGTKIRIYKVDVEIGDQLTPKIRRIELKLKPHKVPQIILFTRHNSTDFLLTSTNGLGLKCYQLSSEDSAASTIFRLSISQLGLTSDMARMVTNGNGSFVVVSDYDGNVVAVDIATERVLCRYPRYDAAPITALAVHPKTDNLILVYADQSFVECSGKTGKYTKFSTNFLGKELLSTYLPKQYLAKPYPTLGVIFPRSQLKNYDDLMIFYDVDKIFVFDKSVLVDNLDKMVTKKVSKMVKTEAGNIDDEQPLVTSLKSLSKSAVMRVTKKYENLVHLDATAQPDDQLTALVAVEVRPEALEAQLPPNLRRKKFGAM